MPLKKYHTCSEVEHHPFLLLLLNFGFWRFVWKKKSHCVWLTVFVMIIPVGIIAAETATDTQRVNNRFRCFTIFYIVWAFYYFSFSFLKQWLQHNNLFDFSVADIFWYCWHIVDLHFFCFDSLLCAELELPMLLFCVKLLTISDWAQMNRYVQNILVYWHHENYNGVDLPFC